MSGNPRSHALQLNRLAKLPRLLRGWAIRRRCSGTGRVTAGRGADLTVQNGEVRLNGHLWLGDQVGIFVGGIDGPAVLTIGPGAILQSRTRVDCCAGVTLGALADISWDVEIMDCDFHGVVVDGSERPRMAPIVIEDRVWVGAHATILKGVTIGHDSVVVAGAVVTRSVPPHSLVAGNPARVVKQIDGWTP